MLNKDNGLIYSIILGSACFMRPWSHLYSGLIGLQQSWVLLNRTASIHRKHNIAWLFRASLQTLELQERQHTKEEKGKKNTLKLK